MKTTMNPSSVCVSDIEGNDLLYRITQMHCGVIVNPFTLEERWYGPSESKAYLDRLQTFGCVVGHNFKGFDLLALKKLFNFELQGFCFDTLVLSRLINPERKQHSLKAWGQQLKFYKGDYKDAFIAKMGDLYEPGMEWREFSEDMMVYCAQDVLVNAVLFLYLIVQLQWWDRFGVTREECQRLSQAIREGDLRRVS